MRKFFPFALLTCECVQVLLYVVDTAGTDLRKPWHDLLLLQKELEAYSQGITSKPSLIIANKMDLNGIHSICFRVISQLRWSRTDVVHLSRSGEFAEAAKACKAACNSSQVAACLYSLYHWMQFLSLFRQNWHLTSCFFCFLR